MNIVVEFFGIPRTRAGRAELLVPAGTVADILNHIETTCPGLQGLRRDGRLAPQYLLSLDGRAFLTDLNQQLSPGDHVLLLSADAGG